MFNTRIETGRFEMIDIQHATLAGGVAVGASAAFMLRPWGAVLLGFVAGMISSFGFARVSPTLRSNFQLRDTCGVHNLHGELMVSIISLSLSWALFFLNQFYFVYCGLVELFGLVG